MAEDILIRFRSLDDASKSFDGLIKRLNVLEDKVGIADKSMGRAFGAKRAGNLKQMQFQTRVLNDQFQNMASRIPIIGSSIAALPPQALAVAAAVGAIAAGIGKAIHEAQKFEHQFLELRNLNLDKTNEQISRLRSNVLNTALSTGKSAEETSKAYFDVQSATGLYGKEVEKVVKIVSDFSTATKAELDPAINQTIKTMRAFKLGADDIEEVMRSNARTIQVGVVTFNELAQEQVEFLGPAAAMNQSLDTANKLFAAFTATAKNARIGATLTKSAFEGLTLPKTLDGLASIGVSMFDAKGQMRGVDDVLREMVPKIQRLSDQQFTTLKGDIGGPEGLKNLLDQVRVSGTELIGVFDQFDKTEFRLEDALKNAKGDLGTMKTILGNQVNTLFAMLGEKILPPIIRAVGFISDGISSAKAAFDEIWNSSLLFRDILSGIGWIIKKSIINGLTVMFDVFRAGFEAFQKVGRFLMNLFGMEGDSVGGRVQTFGELIETTWLKIRTFAFGIAGGIEGVFNGLTQFAKDLLPNIGSAINMLAKGNILGAINKAGEISGGLNIVDQFKKGRANAELLARMERQAFEQEKFDRMQAGGGTPIAPGAGGPGGAGAGGAGLPAVGGAAGRIGEISGGRGGGGARNVTVNITFNYEPTIQGVGRAMEDLQRKVTEIVVQATQDAEIAIST